MIQFNQSDLRAKHRKLFMQDIAWGFVMSLAVGAIVGGLFMEPTSITDKLAEGFIAFAGGTCVVFLGWIGYGILTGKEDKKR